MAKEVYILDDPRLENLCNSLPYTRNDPRILKAAEEKRTRVREWLVKRKLDGVVISQRNNFSWLTCGGDSRVVNNSETGAGHIVITADKQYMVAHYMDAGRMVAEQCEGQGYELVTLRWFEEEQRRVGLKLAGKRAAADTCMPGVEDVSAEISMLHHPFSELEINRSRWVAGATEILLEKLAGQVQPGMMERDVAHLMTAMFALNNMDLDVTIIGSDERILKNRHPLPTLKKIEKYVLLHPVSRRWGLHGAVSRTIHFGKPSEEVRNAYNLAATVQGRIFKMLKPGTKFSEILAGQKAWYAEFGTPEEWKNHYQGGPAGYFIVDAMRNQTEDVVKLNQQFDYFISVTGAKVEEVALLTEKGLEIASFQDKWPGMKIETPAGEIEVPDIWVM